MSYGAERRPDPFNKGSREMYTYQEFIDFYGPEKGKEAWRQGVVYKVGMKVRALTKLEGDKGQVVNKGDIGKVTELPGRQSDISRGAVAEVLINNVRFDAEANMIEPCYPSYDSRPGQHSGGARPERRADPNYNSKKTYTRDEFLSEYGPAKGAAMWKKAGESAAAKEERRADPEEKGKGGEKYTMKEFFDFYGEKKGQMLWKKAGKATQKKEEKHTDPNEPHSNKKYTKKEFIDHYGKKKGAELFNQEDKRSDPNEPNSKKKYTKKEFIAHYGEKRGLSLWKAAGDKGASKEPKPDKKRKFEISKEGSETIGWSRTDLVIVEVEEGKPAEKAGIRPLARIVAINDKEATAKTVTAQIAEAGDSFTVTTVEVRVDNTDPGKRAFSLREFTEFYGDKAESLWKKAKPRTKAPKDRAAKDDEEAKDDAKDSENKVDKEEEAPAEEAKDSETKEKDEA